MKDNDKDQDKDRQTVLRTLKEVARQFKVVKGAVSFMLYEGRANFLEINGRRRFYYVDGRTAQNLSGAQSGDTIDHVLLSVEQNLKRIVLENAGPFGGVEARVNRTEIHARFFRPLGPRGRRRKRRNR